MDPLVSVVVLTTQPARRTLLPDALLSYQLQTYRNKELIVLNDGQRLCPVHPEARVFNLPVGASEGVKRTFAAEVAKGAFIAWWDDDDFSFPGRLAAQVATLLRARMEFVKSNFMWLADEQWHITSLFADMSNATAMLTPRLIRYVGGYPDQRFGTDIAFLSKLYVATTPMAAMDEPFYVHRRHGTNVSRETRGFTIDDYRRMNNRATPAQLAAVNARLQQLLATPRVAYVATC